MRGIRFVTSLSLGLLLVLGLGISSAAAPRQIAIASIFPVADLAQQIAGAQWGVITLLPAGASAHTYEPTPEQVRHFAQARVFFQIGLGLEFWLEKLVRAAQSPELITVDLSTAIEPLPSPPLIVPATPRPETRPRHAHVHPHSTQAKAHQAHAHEGADAHYWLDPVRMQQVATRLERAFTDLDPEHAAFYAEGAERVRANLQALHKEILRQTQGLQKRSFIGLHAAWTYFAARYDLEQAAVVEPFPGREPSPRYLAELARLMRRKAVQAIVIEPQLSSTAAHALARETGARVGMLDPYGGPGVPERESYIELMRYNVAALVKLLE
jgi:zinc transport system substrate-binding protein